MLSLCRGEDLHIIPTHWREFTQHIIYLGMRIHTLSLLREEDSHSTLSLLRGEDSHIIPT